MDLTTGLYNVITVTATYTSTSKAQSATFAVANACTITAATAQTITNAYSATATIAQPISSEYTWLSTCDAYTKQFKSCTSSNSKWIVPAATTNTAVTSAPYVSTVTIDQLASSTGTISCAPLFQKTASSTTSNTITSTITCVPVAQTTGISISRNLVSSTTAISWTVDKMFTNTACRTAPTCTIPSTSTDFVLTGTTVTLKNPT